MLPSLLGDIIKVHDNGKTRVTRYLGEGGKALQPACTCTYRQLIPSLTSHVLLDGGWWKGTLVPSGLYGNFPSNFVEMM